MTMTELAYIKLFQPLLQWLIPISVATFFLSLFIIPLVVNTLSVTCFLNIGRRKISPRISIGTAGLLIISNLCGWFFLLAGIVMLFLPGQGLLTILIGLLLVSFPGKQKLLDYLVHIQSIQHGFDWIRKKSGKSPFVWPDKTEEQHQ